MTEDKICPFGSVRQKCLNERCALHYNGGCVFLDLSSLSSGDMAFKIFDSHFILKTIAEDTSELHKSLSEIRDEIVGVREIIAMSQRNNH